MTATAAKNHDHWRRSVQRDTYVQFLVATGEVEQVRYPLHEEDVTALRGHRSTAQEALDRATSAFYILHLESPDVSQVASNLLTAVREYTHIQEAWAGYGRAQIAMASLENETGTRLTGQRRALERLRVASQATPGSREEEWHHERIAAHNLARESLSRVERLTGQHIHDLVAWAEQQGEPLPALSAVKELREEFLNVARQRLEASDR